MSAPKCPLPKCQVSKWAKAIECNWVPYSNILIPLITLSSINEEFWSSRQWWQTSSVSWVMAFLTCGYKISLVLSKNEWSSRKLLYSVNRHSSQLSNIESDNSQNVGLEDYSNISDGIFQYFTTPSIKITLG